MAKEGLGEPPAYSRLGWGDSMGWRPLPLGGGSPLSYRPYLPIRHAGGHMGGSAPDFDPI